MRIGFLWKAIFDKLRIQTLRCKSPSTNLGQHPNPVQPEEPSRRLVRKIAERSESSSAYHAKSIFLHLLRRPADTGGDRFPLDHRVHLIAQPAGIRRLCRRNEHRGNRGVGVFRVDTIVGRALSGHIRGHRLSRNCVGCLWCDGGVGFCGVPAAVVLLGRDVDIYVLCGSILLRSASVHSTSRRSFAAPT